MTEYAHIYGPRKSGTTLVQSLLDGHEDMFVRPLEVKFPWLCLNDKLIPSYAEDYFEFFAPAHTEILERCNLGSYYIHGYMRSHQIDTFTDVIKLELDALMQASGSEGRRICPMKDLGGSADQTIAYFRQNFGFDSKVIAIHRDPLMIVKSLLRDRARKNIKVSRKWVFQKIAEAFRVDQEIKKQEDNAHTFIIKYEELVLNPDHEVR